MLGESHAEGSKADFFMLVATEEEENSDNNENKEELDRIRTLDNLNKSMQHFCTQGLEADK